MKAVIIFRLFCWVIFGLAITILAAFHEVWRDEMRALSLSMDSHSLSDLFNRLRNEGHPGLWHLILYASFQLFHTTLVLKAASLVIAFAAVGVFFFKSPFSLLQKCLFALGFFPLYEYSVISRNYGIGMLLLFLLACVYSDRFKRPVTMGGLLFLLSHTAFHFTIISSVVVVSLVIEKIKHGKEEQGASPIETVLGLLLGTAGVLSAFWHVMPDRTSIVTRLYQIQGADVFNAFINALALPATHYTGLLGFGSFIVTTIIIFVLYAYFWRTAYLFFILFTSLLALSMFFTLVYPGHMRHQGVLYILIIALLWMDKITTGVPRNGQVFWNGLLTFLLIGQVVISVRPIYLEITRPYSSSLALSKILNTRPDLERAIIIGETDHYLESLPYYMTHEIYFVREERFGRTVSYTAKSRPQMTLREMLESARKLERVFARPVVIVMSHRLSPRGPFPQDRFIYNETQILQFLSNTKKIASLYESMHENYDVYVLQRENKSSFNA